jgi:hypothetical protein
MTDSLHAYTRMTFSYTVPNPLGLAQFRPGFPTANLNITPTCALARIVFYYRAWDANGEPM